MTTAATGQPLTMSPEIGALTEKLRPAGSAEVARHIQSMMNAGLTFPGSIDADDDRVGDKRPDPADVYAYALQDVPLYGLRRATEKLIKGEYAGNPDILLGVIPKPPVLAAISRLEAKPLVDDRIRLTERQKYAQAPRLVSSQPSPDFKDWRKLQAERVRDLKCQGFYQVESKVTLDEFVARGRRRVYAAGTLFFWALQEAWAPQEHWGAPE